MKQPAPQIRWRQIGLRKFLIAAAVAGLLLGWAGDQLRSWFSRPPQPSPMSDLGAGLPTNSRNAGGLAGDWPNEGEP